MMSSGNWSQLKQQQDDTPGAMRGCGRNEIAIEVYSPHPEHAKVAGGIKEVMAADFEY